MSILLAATGRAAAGEVQLLANNLNSMLGYPLAAGERAFSAGTTWCTLGDEQLSWVADTNQHPISALNLDRIKDGLMVHIGASWATHQGCAPMSTPRAKCDGAPPTPSPS
jgi:hypothetical protein